VVGVGCGLAAGLRVGRDGLVGAGSGLDVPSGVPGQETDVGLTHLAAPRPKTAEMMVAARRAAA